MWIASLSKFVPAPVYGIEALLAVAMGAMMMNSMGQQTPQTPTPAEPQAMPDPNAPAIKAAADAEKAALMSDTEGRQGTNLSNQNRTKLGSNTPSPSDSNSGTSDYKGSVLGG